MLWPDWSILDTLWSDWLLGILWVRTPEIIVLGWRAPELVIWTSESRLRSVKMFLWSPERIVSERGVWTPERFRVSVRTPEMVVLATRAPEMIIWAHHPGRHVARGLVHQIRLDSLVHLGSSLVHLGVEVPAIHAVGRKLIEISSVELLHVSPAARRGISVS